MFGTTPRNHKKSDRKVLRIPETTFIIIAVLICLFTLGMAATMVWLINNIPLN